jgi:hypothetical protein
MEFRILGPLEVVRTSGPRDEADAAAAGPLVSAGCRKFLAGSRQRSI